MKWRPLAIGDETREAVRLVRERAEKPENWFRPGPSRELAKLQGSKLRPGDDPKHVVVIPHEFKCVFSWTVGERISDGSPIVVRDLSVSVPGATPHLVLVFEIAELFGFTAREPGANPFDCASTWHVDLDQCRPPCVTVIEEAPVSDVVRECEDRRPRSAT